MVWGIVLFAFGLKTALHGTGHPLGIVPAFGLLGGIALYLLAHVALRLRIGGGLGRGRPIAAVVLVALLPVSSGLTALLAVAIVAAVCVALIIYEAVRHREARALIRRRRAALTPDEIARLERRGSREPTGN
jgi:hypothetical protein